MLYKEIGNQVLEVRLYLYSSYWANNFIYLTMGIWIVYIIDEIGPFEWVLRMSVDSECLFIAQNI